MTSPPDSDPSMRGSDYYGDTSQIPFGDIVDLTDDIWIRPDQSMEYPSSIGSGEIPQFDSDPEVVVPGREPLVD